MKTFRSLLISSFPLLFAFTLSAQSRLGDNAALRYWSAFAEMQDSSISDKDAVELNQIVAGTAPYVDSKYKDLVERNHAALSTMARGTELAGCDWGVEYQLGSEAPVEYVRKALALGRLNILYSFHLLITRDNEGAVHALAAGVRFAHDVANDGTLFAALASKSLLVSHFGLINFMNQNHSLSVQQKAQLQKAVAQIGDGVDWQAAVKREMAIPHPASKDAQSSAALAVIAPLYVKAMENSGVLTDLQQKIAASPQALQQIIPNPARVLEAKQDLDAKLQQLRSGLE